MKLAGQRLLHQVHVRQRLNGLRHVGKRVKVSRLRESVLSLQRHSFLCASLDGLLDRLVLLLSRDDLRLARGGLEVRSGDVKCLPYYSSVHLRIDGGNIYSIVKHCGNYHL